MSNRTTRVTPPGTLAFAKWLYATQEKFSKGKYVGTLMLAKGVKENDDFAAERIARHLSVGGDPLHAPVKDGDSPNRDGTVHEYNRGLWICRFKSASPVVVRDAKKNKLDPKVMRVASGDTVRFGWSENVQTTPGQWNGVALYLDGVQLLAKRSADTDFDAWVGDDAFDVTAYAGPQGAEQGVAPSDGFDF